MNRILILCFISLFGLLGISCSSCSQDKANSSAISDSNSSTVDTTGDQPITISGGGSGGAGYCGDGHVKGSEACDDHNKANGDGCDSICMIESGWTCAGDPPGTLCALTTICAAGEYEITPPTPNTDRVCGTCTIGLTVTNSTLNPASCTDTIGLNAGNFAVSTPIGSVTWDWTPTSNLNDATSQDPNFTGPGATGNFTYTATVTDSVGCTASTGITVSMTASGTQIFGYTGGIQTFTVPPCVTSVSIDALGAQGGSGASGGSGPSAGSPAAGGLGGQGGRATGTLTVTPGQTLNIFVGGQGSAPTGGFNGGGNGGSVNAGGGGGASDVRVGGTAESDRIIVAGGGGGGGRAGCEPATCIGAMGGAGGGESGADGAACPTSGGFAGGGFGGLATGAGGANGIGCGGFLGSPGGTTTNGTGGAGGAGQSCCCFISQTIPGGGGGGGGSAGTTGCSGNDKGPGGGGAGGTNYIGGVTAGTTANGTQSGNGQVTVSW